MRPTSHVEFVARSPHGDDGVQIDLDSLLVGGEQVRLGRLDSRVLHHRLHRRVDVVEVVDRVDVRHVARVQDVVDVLEERLVLDLRMTENT